MSDTPSHDFYPEDVSNLRNLPDIPWGIGGKSGSEHVADWRNDLANRIERILDAAHYECPFALHGPYCDARCKEGHP